MTNDEIATFVTQRIDQSIRASLPREVLITTSLVIDVAVGLFIIVHGVRQGGWLPVAAGSACQVAIGWPIAKLLALRQDNLYLQILPSLIRMADRKDQKELIYEFAKRMMRKL